MVPVAAAPVLVVVVVAVAPATPAFLRVGHALVHLHEDLQLWGKVQRRVV